MDCDQELTWTEYAVLRAKLEELSASRARLRAKSDDAAPEPPEDRSTYPRCPACWTNGHTHRKTCRYVNDGMTHHVRPQRRPT